jgi:hypothetical protein
MKSLLTNLTLWSLSLGHFCIDLFSGALPIVMVFMARALNLDLAQVGLVIGLYSLSTSLTQPIFGLLSDRYGGRWFAVGGLLWMALGYALVGFATSFPAVLAITTLAGFGSAAFHPQGASGANVASGDRKTAGVAVFSTAAGYKPEELDIGPNPERVTVRNNIYAQNGFDPAKQLRDMGLTQGADVVWDVSNWNNSFDEPKASAFPPVLPGSAWPDFAKRSYWKILDFAIKKLL